MKKIIALLICIVALVCAGVLCSVSGYADTDVVFCDAKGKDTNSGTETAPVKTLEAAYKKLPEGGVIVLKSDITVKGTVEMPEHKGTVTITSKHNGTEYGGKLTNSAETFVKLNGSTVLADVTVKSSKAITFVAQFNPIVFDDGFKVEYTGTADRKSDLRVIGGFYAPTEEQTEILDRDSYITINSGDIYLLVGSSKSKGKGTMLHTGTSHVTVNGGSVDILYGGTHANHAGQNAVITVNGGEIDRLSAAGDATRRLYGDFTANLNGGKIKTFDVNNVIGDATVNMVGTVPESITVSYKDDSLRQMAEKNKSYKTINYNALICTNEIISHIEEIFDEAVNTTCIYVSSQGKGDGSTQKAPVGSLAAAYEKLKVGGGRIILIGQVKCDMTAETLGGYSGIITVVGQDESAALLLDRSASYYFEADTVIDSIKLKATGSATLAACYNSLTITDTVGTEGDISVVGSGVKSAPKTVSLTLAGGSYKSVSAIGAGASADGTDAEITINGAAVEKLTLSTVAGSYGYGAVSVNGDGVESIDTCEAGSFSEISVKVLEAEVGSLRLNGAKDRMFLNVSHAKFTNAVEAGELPEKENCVLLLGNEVDETKLASVSGKFGVSKNGNIIYISDEGTGNGVSPDAPMGDLNEAVKALGGEGTVVIVGTYTITEKTQLDEYDYPIVITSVGSDRDYRATGSALVFEASLCLGGETTIEYINMSVGKSVYIYAMTHKLVIGEEANTTLTNANKNYINIVGGRNDAINGGDVDVTVNSGDWGILRGGASESGVYNTEAKINITINGGTFHRYVVLASRGKVTGNIECTVNGGTFLQGFYGVYEEDGKFYKADYQIKLTINGGAFYQQIAPAHSRNTVVDGKYELYINGGDFSSCTDVMGSELFAGSMSSYVYVSESVNANKNETGIKTYRNPVDPNAPDPWVFYHDGYYYYTHTTGTKIILMKAMNIGDITTSAETVVISPTEGEDMWSPEIHYFSPEEVGEANAGWYLYIAYDHGESGTRRAHVLKCKNGDDFFGDWVNPVTGALNVPEKIVFPDYPELDSIGTNGGYSKLVVNGKTYMTFIRSVNRGTPEYHQKLCIAEIDTPWSYKGVPVTLTVSEYEWESHGYGQDSITGGWYPKVIEGASAVYGDNGEVYIMYTGSGYWTIYYALGYLKYIGGDPLDPASWQKNPTPVLSYNDEVTGCGHGSYYRDHNGDYYVAYHGYLGKNTNENRWMFIERIYVTAEGVTIGNGTGHPAPLATIYEISANPMPLADKISGFGEKEEKPLRKPTEDTTPDTSVDTSGGDSEDEGDVTVLIIVIAAAAVLGAGTAGALFVLKKKKGTGSEQSGDKN